MVTTETNLESMMQSDGFRITDDKTADWAIKVIGAEETERDRLIELAKAEIADLEAKIQTLAERCESSTRFLRGELRDYFEHVAHKETKTQETYKLLNGNLVMKKPKQKILHDDEVLLVRLAGTQYIKTKETVDWAGFKENLEILDGQVVNTETGEIVEGCSVEETPGEFIVKVG